jgi:pimeloyl-ACP methyl ester carboxylesterase
MPLVLAHGFGGSARNFRPQARAFAERCTTYLYDARGHARSAAPQDPGAYQAHDLIADFAGVAAQASEPVIAGGLSLGAYTALGFALSAPERVRGLVLAAFPSPGSDPERARWAREFADAIAEQGLEAAGERFVWGERSRFDPKGAALIRQGFLEHNPGAMVAILRSVLGQLPAVDTLAQGLLGLDVPAVVIVGENDVECLPHCRRLAELLPDARLVVVPGAGHVVNLAAPEAFNDALGELLDRVG